MICSWWPDGNFFPVLTKWWILLATTGRPQGIWTFHQGGAGGRWESVLCLKAWGGAYSACDGPAWGAGTREAPAPLTPFPGLHKWLFDDLGGRGKCHKVWNRQVLPAVNHWGMRVREWMEKLWIKLARFTYFIYINQKSLKWQNCAFDRDTGSVGFVGLI